MADSEDEDEACYYGTPLEPYDEDSFPKKKPIAIEDQVAKDAQGRRRFHGAFTGGFSAGFFNTVGSLEGWTPTEFRSSRTEKATSNVQMPQDYMDDEDLGEFGIAPQTVRAKSEYNDSKKRKKQVFSDGPIPGMPVLETLIEAGNETVGYFLMKNMNRKHHQSNKLSVRVYGCAMPSNAPDDELPTNEFQLDEYYKQYLRAPKSNTFGLGYTSLDNTSLNLFQPAKLTIRERNNKKLSISGQAFGVGAFEDEDDDIYVKEDLTRYDFELTSETVAKAKDEHKNLLHEMFVITSKSLLFANKTTFPPPTIPPTFTGKYKVKKSRFEPIATEPSPTPILNAAIRAKYLGEDHPETYTPSKPIIPQPPVEEERVEPLMQIKNETLDNILTDRFVSAKEKDDPTNILEPVKKSNFDHGTDEMRAAVKMKMFGPLTRVTLAWQPCALLCKRFNVPEPNFENPNAEKRKRTKHLIFQYQTHEEKQLQYKPGLDVKPATGQTQNETIVDTNSDSKIEVVERTTLDKPLSVTQVLAIDITDRLDIAQKTDLFKAVFLSSSESDTSDKEDNEDESAKKKAELENNILLDPLVPKIVPRKEGILSNLNFLKLQPNMEHGEKLQLVSEPSNTYGPCLPNTLQKVTANVTNELVSNIDEWVEKDQVNRDRKYKKKHRKEKKKHKHKFHK